MMSYRKWAVLTGRVLHMRGLKLVLYGRKAMRSPGLSSENTACTIAYYITIVADYKRLMEQERQSISLTVSALEVNSS